MNRDDVIFVLELIDAIFTPVAVVLAGFAIYYAHRAQKTAVQCLAALNTDLTYWRRRWGIGAAAARRYPSS
jgi:hypothetical protein